jgi:hypothetical protein
LKILRKRLFKTLPVWLLALLLIGSAAAAFLWISNQITTWVLVKERGIELIGSFQSSDVYKNETTYNSFTYTINNMSQSTGYIYLEFQDNFAGALNPGDIEIDSINVYPDSFFPVDVQLVSGYPTNPYPNVLAFVFENQSGGAFDFSVSGLASFGFISIEVRYKVSTQMITRMQITSTSS